MRLTYALTALSGVIAARNNLGKIIGDEIKEKLGLSDMRLL